MGVKPRSRRGRTRAFLRAVRRRRCRPWRGATVVL